MKKLSSILMIMLVGILLLAGCGESDEIQFPNTNSTVISNGSMIVQKEDYVYFVSGYVSANDLTNPKTDNVFGDVVTGAIYRVKLTNGVVPTDEEGNISGTEVVVPKVVGFENGGFYIFGDYIYYATPDMGSDNSGTLLNDKVNFCMISINGGKDTNNTLAEGVDVADGEWKSYFIDGSVYFVIYAESTLTSIKVVKEDGESVTMATGVTSASLPDGEIYSPTNRESASEYEGKTQLEDYNQWIYYTQDKLEDSSKKGNVFLKVKIGSENSTTLEQTDTVYSVVEQNNGYLYYTKENGRVEDSLAILYKANIENGFNDEARLANAEYDNMYIVQQDLTTAVIIKTGTLLKVSTDGGTTYKGLLTIGEDDSITVIRAYGNYIYYYNGIDGTLNRVNIFDRTITNLYTEDDDNKLSLDSDLNADVVNNKVVFYLENDEIVKTLLIDLGGNLVNALIIDL